MSNDDTQNLAKEVARLSSLVGQLQNKLKKFEDSAQYTFQKNIQILDGNNIKLGGVQGTKIGVSTSKIGFYGTSPVVQAGTISAPINPTGIYNQTTAQSAVTAINAIITALANIGIIA